MKTRVLIQILLFAALVPYACAQAISVLPETEIPPKAGIGQPVVLPDSEPGQAVTGQCSRRSDAVHLLINSVHQYCLQYPAAYDLFYPSESEMWLVKRSVQNTSDPSVRIKVQPAGEMTLEQAADQIVEIYAIPGERVARQPVTIDGEAAIMLDGLSGQDPNRQVVVLHDDRLYNLYFIQINENQPEAYAEAERLYNTVIQSFNFRPDTNACPGCQAAENDLQAASILKVKRNGS